MGAAVHGLVVDHTTNRGGWAGSRGYRRRRQRPAWRGAGTRAGGDAVPGPHRVAQIVAGIHRRPVIKRVGIGIQVSLVEPLPFGPEPIDIAVQEKEQGIARCGRGIDDVTGAVAGVGSAVRVVLDATVTLTDEGHAEGAEDLAAVLDDRCLRLQARRIAGRWESLSPHDA